MVTYDINCEQAIRALDTLSNYITHLDAQGVLFDNELHEIEHAESVLYHFIKEREGSDAGR